MGGSDAADSQASQARATSLGALLRDARMAQDLTVEQLSAELRIEARQLHALEENRFEQIGVPVFVKGYIKQYAHRFHLNLADLLALYYEQAKLAEVELKPNRTIKLRDDRQMSHWIVVLLVLLSIGVGAAVWWWNGGSFAVVRALNVAPDTDSAVATPAVATGAAVAPVIVAPEAVPEVLASEPGAAAAPSNAVDASTATGADAAAPISAASADSSTEERGADAGLVPLDFTFAAESWAEVTDARGERLLFGLISAGRRPVVRGEPPFTVLLGNATAVELRVDGVPYEIPAADREDNLARFSVDIAED